MPAIPIPDLVVFGVPAVGLIIALVQLCKRYGLDARWAPLVAIGVGVGLSLLGNVAALYPAFAEWYEAAGNGLIVGLIAAGLYSGQKAVRGK